MSRIKSGAYKEALLGYTFLLPSLAGFSLFLFYPFFKSIYLSLHRMNPRGQVLEFIGFTNFIEIFESGQFINSIKTSLYLAVLTIPAIIVIATLLAMLTSKKSRFNAVMQFVFASTLAIPIANASAIWKFLFHPSSGIFNHFLGFFNIPPIGWLVDPKFALISISIMTIWLSLGFAYLIILSGVKGVPVDLYESAKIDGAGPIRTAFNITVPLISPVLFFVSVISVISSLQTFAQINILTKGGPMYTTNVAVYDLYQEAFINYRFDTGSAQALVLFLIILIFTVIQFRLGERKVHYS